MRKFTKSETIQPECEASFEQQLKTSVGQAEYQGLVRLITQVLDAAASGTDINMRIGTTKSRDALILTIYQDDEKLYATGSTWASFLESAKSLL